MRTSVILSVLALFAGQPDLAAQNLVKNGNFSGSTLAPWTASGFAGTPQVETYNTSGTGVSHCYALNPGGQSGRPPFPPHVLKQTGIVFVPLLHELSFDLAATIPPMSMTAAVPKVEVFVGKQRIYSKSFTWRGPNPKRLRACIRYTPTIPGQKDLSFEFSFAGLVRANFTPRVFIDNIDLRRANNPTFCMQGERRLGAAIEFAVTGTPLAAFVVFLSPKLSAQPIPVPGATGAFRLVVVTFVPILVGSLD